MASSSSSPSLETAIDRLARGDWEAAARHALALLAGDPEHLTAGVVLAEILAQRGRGTDDAGPRLAERLLRRRDLPAATHAALVGGGDPGPVLATIARTVGHGARRLARGAPPPLPSPASSAAGNEPLLRGGALLDAAADALANLLELADPVPDGADVPEHPLFSAIPAVDLAGLLGRMHPRNVSPGETILAQGDAGAEAFLVVRGLVDVLRRGPGDGGGGDDGAEQRLAQLGDGAIFGELALVADTPRGASVRAARASQLLEITREDLEALASPPVEAAFVQFTRARLVDHLVRSSPLFQDLPPADVQTLVGRFETRSHHPGDLLLRRGDDGSGLHLVASGRLRVDGVDQAGDAVELARVGPGEVVGEMSLVRERPVGADVVAETPAVTLHLARAAFDEVAHAHPSVLAELRRVAEARDELSRALLASPMRHPSDPVVV